MKVFIQILICLLAFLCTSLCFALPAMAETDTVYLSDRQDLMLPRDYEDSIGWDTAHSGERITTWDLSFDKGIGMHCRQNGDAYIEFDISSLDMNYFYATVGVLKDAGYYIAEGSISFSVYGDGELLVTTPVIQWGQKAYYICVPVKGVKTLKLVENNAGSWVCDAGVWGDAALCKDKPEPPEWSGFDRNRTDEKQLPETVAGDFAYISDLYFKSYTGTADCRDTNTAGEMIVSMDGKFFRKGVGFHAGSSDYSVYIDIDIEGLGYTKFVSYYGISETVTSNDIAMAKVKFAVFGDGKKLFESAVMTYDMPMKAMECDVTGVKTLRLAIAGAPHIDGGWGTFGGAVLSKSGNVTDDMLYGKYTFDKVYRPISKPSTKDEVEAPPTQTAPSENASFPVAGVIGAAAGALAVAALGTAVVLGKQKKRKEQ